MRKCYCFISPIYILHCFYLRNDELCYTGLWLKMWNWNEINITYLLIYFSCIYYPSTVFKAPNFSLHLQVFTARQGSTFLSLKSRIRDRNQRTNYTINYFLNANKWCLRKLQVTLRAYTTVHDLHLEIWIKPSQWDYEWIKLWEICDNWVGEEKVEKFIPKRGKNMAECS